LNGFGKRFGRKKLPQGDKDFVHLHLTEQGALLFFQMDPADQRHAIAVAKAILAKRGYQADVKLEVLIQAALLHDVGKVLGDLTPLSRIFVGLIRRIAPNLREKWANRSGNALERACYVDLHHPVRGAYMASIFGISPEVAEAIRSHHRAPGPDDSKLLIFRPVGFASASDRTFGSGYL
jgi:putative nucleotidyltransferase with HDIG domain